MSKGKPQEKGNPKVCTYAEKMSEKIQSCLNLRTAPHIGTDFNFINQRPMFQSEVFYLEFLAFSKPWAYQEFRKVAGQKQTNVSFSLST